MNAPLLQTIASYGVILTLVLVFMMIALGTALSVFGVVTFPVDAQQRTLFRVVIVTLMVGVCGTGVAYFKGALLLDTKVAAARITQVGYIDYWKSHQYSGVHDIKKPADFPVKYTYAEGEVSGSFTYDEVKNIYVESNQRLNAPAWI